MTKVWIVSGFVLIGTGLALAGFGAWLSGNANCDAGDLGRSCMAASLGVAVMGLALTLAGWLRLRRTQGADASEEGSGGLIVRRPGLVMIAFAVVGLIVLTFALPGPQPPASIYGGPAPVIETNATAFLPPLLADLARTDLTSTPDGLREVGEAGYAGGVFVRVTRYNADVNWTPPPAGWNATRNEPFWAFANTSSVQNATAAADAYVSGQYSALGTQSSARLCVREGPRLWFASEQPGKSVLSWREGTYVFEVSAPTAPQRNAVAAAVAAAA